METCLYKEKEYEVLTGPKGGKYIMLNGRKHYVKPAEVIVKKDKPKTYKLYKYVTDPEHEGDIDNEIQDLEEIGPIDIDHIDREYTDDGEELTEACIYFTCKAEDYKKFKEYCRF